MIVAEPGKYQGRVIAVNSSIVDVAFTPPLPPMQALLLIEFGDEDKDTIMLEVAGHLSETMVRAIALTPVAGLKRDQPVSSNGEPLSIPVGSTLLGRMLNVFGEIIDNGNALEGIEHHPIYATPPPLSQRTVTPEIIETGIKIIDLLAPLEKGGKAGMFGGAGVSRAQLECNFEVSCPVG